MNPLFELMRGEVGSLKHTAWRRVIRHSNHRVRERAIRLLPHDKGSLFHWVSLRNQGGPMEALRVLHAETLRKL